jgi:hypothetical protein
VREGEGDGEGDGEGEGGRAREMVCVHFTWLALLTSAPRSSSSRTAASWPFEAAMIRPVQPVCRSACVRVRVS